MSSLDNRRWNTVRTKMIECSTCMHAPLIARCTRHSLKLIEALYSITINRSVRDAAIAITATDRHTLTRQEETVTGLRYLRKHRFQKIGGAHGTYNTVMQKEAVDQSSSDCRLPVGFRRRPTTPQPAATRLQNERRRQANRGCEKENRLTERCRDSH